MSYGMSRTVKMGYDEAVTRVKAALQEEGFGALTEIDVQATLREKRGISFERYLIIGACNPDLAHQALVAEREVGLLLPCNVVVREEDGRTVVQALDPAVIVRVAENPALAPIADEARERIGRALAALGD